MTLVKKTLMMTIAGVLAGMLVAAPALTENVFEAEVEKETSAVKLAREVQMGNYDLVTTAELNAWISEGKQMLIIDAMPRDHYEKKHIPGAKQFLFPVEEMLVWDADETGGKAALDYAAFLGTDKERPIVVYCGFVKCGRSHNGAMWAKRLGYKNVFRHPGGIYAWQGAGYEMQASE